MKIGKFEFPRKLERLEVYLLAADNPVGKKQFRPIFRRKRNRIVLTREQVYAIKRGRRVLRAEMKARGLKRRIDFEETATNLGLHFDRNRLLWPFFLWLIRDNTVVKILATTVVLTTIMTVTEPVIEYVTQYVTQYVTEYITEHITDYITEEKDRFTISMSDEMFDEGFQLSKSKDFANPSERLVFDPVWDASPMSIAEIPWDIDKDVLTLAPETTTEEEETTEEETTEGTDPTQESSNVVISSGQTQNYFACTFYYRYINTNATADAAAMSDPTMIDLAQYQTSYNWELQITNDILGKLTEGESGTEGSTDPLETTAPDDSTGETESGESGPKPSDAIWVMIFRDGEMILCAKPGADGKVEKLPSDAILADPQTARAFVDRAASTINTGLAGLPGGITMDNVGRMRQQGYQEAVDNFFNANDIKDLTQLMVRTADWDTQYVSRASRGTWDYYQVVPENFKSDTVVARRENIPTLPYVDAQKNVHRYTIVFWMEGDDPDCTNKLMNSHIGMTFQISGKEETAATDPTGESTEPTGESTEGA